MKLFRYLPIDDAFWRELTGSELYCGHADGLNINDPPECRIDMEAAIARARAVVTDRERLEEIAFLERRLDRYEEKRSAMGVCSFSAVPDNTVNWSRRADDHKGVCLTYSLPDDYIIRPFPRADAGSVLLGVQPVKYGNNAVTEWLVHGDFYAPTGGSIVDNAAVRSVTTKGIAWAYEQEVRLLTHEKSNFRLPLDSLNQVMFGMSISDEAKQQIARRAKERNPSVKFLQAQPSAASDYGMHVMLTDFV